MNSEDHDEFLCRIAKTLYYGDTSSFDSVSLPLTELAAEIYNEVKKQNTLERLQVREIAEINENACVSTCSLVLAILYLEKIKSSNPNYVEKVAPSELFLVSLLIASKFLNDDGEDDAITNSEWAACAGLSLNTVNRIEKEFLNAIKWEVHIGDKLFWSRLLLMERYLANQEGKRRGWYSYTEFNILITAHEFCILKEVLKYSLVCLTCYTGTLCSLVCTALLAIRAKHFLLNCIFYILLQPTIVNISEPHDVDELISNNNSTLAAQNPEIPVLLNYDDGLVMINNKKNICDSSWLQCVYSNFTSEKLFFKIKETSTSYMRTLKYLTVRKTNVDENLFHSHRQWLYL